MKNLQILNHHSVLDDYLTAGKKAEKKEKKSMDNNRKFASCCLFAINP